MSGVTLSRWTMSYFATAVVALLAAQGLMAAGYGYPAAPIEAPQTLVLVHLIAIGWLSLLMCGALFQFVPVLVARQIYSNALPLPTLLCLVSGLAGLLLGFLQLAGHALGDFPFLPVGAVLLGVGFTLAIWNLSCTLYLARPLTLPARFVALGLFGLGATVLFGIVFAMVLGGVTSYSHFVDVTTLGLPIHIIAGLGGWLTLTAIGVSYRLLAMFMLSPELSRKGSHAAFGFGAAALAVAIGGGVAAICLSSGLTVALLASAALGLAALGFYWRDMIHLYRVRMRRKIELNSRMAAFAIASLAGAVILGIVLAALGRFTEQIGAVIFLVGFGWLSGLGLAKLYKIVAFLTWLECYGPILGKTPTPRVQDLVVEPRAIKWFGLYFAAVWCASAALLFDAGTVFRILAAAMLIATCGIAVQLLRTRRLADVKAEIRLPNGARKPRLLFSLAQ